jgi:hypothetical protein
MTPDVYFSKFLVRPFIFRKSKQNIYKKILSSTPVFPFSPPLASPRSSAVTPNDYSPHSPHLHRSLSTGRTSYFPGHTAAGRLAHLGPHNERGRAAGGAHSRRAGVLDGERHRRPLRVDLLGCNLSSPVAAALSRCRTSRGSTSLRTRSQAPSRRRSPPTSSPTTCQRHIPAAAGAPPRAPSTWGQCSTSPSFRTSCPGGSRRSSATSPASGSSTLDTTTASAARLRRSSVTSRTSTLYSCW